MAIKIFKNMKSCGFPADAATYHIMIDCCSILRCYRSACALVSMMLRDGFFPLTITYTTLIKVFLFYLGHSRFYIGIPYYVASLLYFRFCWKMMQLMKH